MKENKVYVDFEFKNVDFEKVFRQRDEASQKELEELEEKEKNEL